MKKLRSTPAALPPRSPLSAPTAPSDPFTTIGPVARSSVVDAVSDKLRSEILGGRIAAGSRLPSERELALTLGVNRLTLRAALGRLEALGLVTTRHGSGTEVSEWRERAGLEALPMVLRSLQEGEQGWLDLLTSLLEVRRILAAEAVALAAVRHDEDDLAQLRAIAAEQKTRVHDPVAYAKGDLAFQRVLIRAARNVGFELILNSFSRFPEELPEVVAQLYDRRAEVIGFYEAVIDLVKSRDKAAAKSATLAALTALDEDWLTRHGYGGATPGKAAAPKAAKKKRAE